ncbi:PepSY domain-containing protein [Methylophilaceae bacterium]|nr:PepSY domain-containing protein [Methylophilaceae bacterium]
MKKKLKKIVDLHRYVGLGICIFLVHLAITGIFLNHSIGLRLDKTFITWPWLLNQYNLTVPEPANIFTIGKNNFSTIDGEVFFNDKPIFLAEEDLLGVSQNQDTFILASSSTITMISNEGYIINKENVLPFTVKNIGINGDEVVINDSEDKIWSSESINGVWELTQNRAVQWSMEGSITPINHEKIRKYFVGDGVSLEQVILDFHSGAIFQKAGKLFFDIISILLIILSFTGIWLWTIKRKY